MHAEEQVEFVINILVFYFAPFVLIGFIPITQWVSRYCCPSLAARIDSFFVSTTSTSTTSSPSLDDCRLALLTLRQALCAVQTRHFSEVSPLDVLPESILDSESQWRVYEQGSQSWDVAFLGCLLLESDWSVRLSDDLCEAVEVMVEVWNKYRDKQDKSLQEQDKTRLRQASVEVRKATERMQRKATAVKQEQ